MNFNSNQLYQDYINYLKYNKYINQYSILNDPYQQFSIDLIYLNNFYYVFDQLNIDININSIKQFIKKNNQHPFINLLILTRFPFNKEYLIQELEYHLQYWLKINAQIHIFVAFYQIIDSLIFDNYFNKHKINKFYQKYYITFYHQTLTNIELDQILNIFYQYCQHSIITISNEYLHLIIYPFIQDLIENFNNNKQYNFEKYIFQFKNLLP